MSQESQQILELTKHSHCSVLSRHHDSNYFKEGFEKQCFKYFYGQLLPCSRVFMLLAIASATEANCEISNLFIPWYIHTHLQQ